MVLGVVLLGLGLLAALTPVITARFGRDSGYVLAAGFLVVGGALGTQLPVVLGGGSASVALTWLPSFGVSAALRLDGLSLLFSLLVLGVGALIMAYCARYLDPADDHTRWYVLLTLFAAAMLGLLLADDLVLLFAFWEFTTVSSFLLISTTGPDAGRPAARALLVTGGGGLALLAAVVLIGVATGTTSMSALLADPQLLLDSPMAGPVGALLIIAAITKSAQLPFHFWLPDAMVAITPVSAYLHAATMVKAGLYLLMRFTPLYAGSTRWTAALVTIGLVTAVTGAFLALRQYDLKSLLAYSTVSQLGLLVATTGVGTPDALAAASVHLLAHALFEAMVGIPGPPWAGLAAGAGAVAASTLTFAYAARICYDAFGGPTLQKRLYEPPYSLLAPAAVPAVLGIALGPAVGVLNPLIDQSVRATLLTDVGAELEFWHGFTAEVWMSLATMAIGTGLFLARKRLDRPLHGFPLRVHGSTAFDRSHAALISLGAGVARPWRSLRLTAHLPWPIVSAVVIGVVAVSRVDDLPPPPLPLVGPLDVPLIVLLAAAVGLLVLVRSVLAAIGLLGVTGLIVATWFLLAGAPDLALALVLVEILTVVVAVLVVRGLPPRFARSSRRRGLGAAVLALAAGATAGVATFALTGRRGLSEPAEYFLTEAERLTCGTNVVNTVLAVASRVLVPVMLAVSVYLLLTGHDQPGGGFSGALVAGVAIALGYLARGGYESGLPAAVRPGPEGRPPMPDPKGDRS